MRPDIKVGMVIAVILVGIGLVWFVFFRDARSEDKSPGTRGPEVPVRPEDTNIVENTPPVRTESSRPLAGTPLVRPVYQLPEPEAPATPDVTPDETGHTVIPPLHLPPIRPARGAMCPTGRRGRPSGERQLRYPPAPFRPLPRRKGPTSSKKAIHTGPLPRNFGAMVRCMPNSKRPIRLFRPIVSVPA